MLNVQSLLLYTIAVFLYGFSSAQDSNLTETVIINAAFEEVAPCPCDLTQGACDINCCCDSECTTSERETFSSCIPFLPGGQEAETQQYKCSSQHFSKEDWFPVLCVEFEYNAFLGYYFDWQEALSYSLQTFLNRLNSVYFYWFRETESRTITDSSASGYTYGKSLKTYKPLTNTSVERRGFLTIPQPSLAGSCMNNAPVRYLKDIDTSCTYSMSESLCTGSSVLSQLYYTQASTIAGTDTTFFSVAEMDSSSQIASTTVTYKCADAAYLSSYLKSTQNSNNIVDNTQSSLFDYALPTNPNCVDDCGLDICSDTTTVPDPVQGTNLPSDCTSQIPTSPTLIGGFCQYAVIDVKYNIKWIDKKVVSLDAIVIVANNISIQNSANTGANELTQKYMVTFEHNTTQVGEGSTDNFNNITDSGYQRSGRVGYDIGKPIFSGSAVFDNTSTPAEFIYVNTNLSQQIRVFDTSADGLCFNAGSRSIRFGESISSSCRLMLAMSDFNDCTQLRKILFNRLNALMPSNVVGRRGYNDPANSGYWINILRPDLSLECRASETFPVGLSPVDNRTGICYNVTTGIHLDVLYAITGRSNSYPIYEVIGARISYTNTTLRVSCSGLSPQVCTGTRSQPFYVHSSVKFTEVPPKTPEPVKKYYETPEEDDKELCPGDRCWDNLFYPFTNRYMSDSKEYVFGMVSLSIIFFVGYGLVTRPWW